MAVRLISSLLLVLALCVFPLFAQDMVCPEGSALETDTTTFVLSTTQQKLLPLLGDFYSPFWQQLFPTASLTTSPPHRTLRYPPTLHETLLTPATTTNFTLTWALATPFTPPTLTRTHTITSYTQTLAVHPVCASTYSLITWHTHACISGASPATTLQWLIVQHRIAAQIMFAQVAPGWFGGVSSDPEGNGCGHVDTRVPTLTPVASGGDDEGLAPTPTETIYKSYAVMVGAGVTLKEGVDGMGLSAVVTPSAETVSATETIYKSYAVIVGAGVTLRAGADGTGFRAVVAPSVTETASATETISKSYAVVLGPGMTLTWPVEGTPVAVVRPVNATAAAAKETYSVISRAGRGRGCGGMWGLILAGVGLMML